MELIWVLGLATAVIVLGAGLIARGRGSRMKGYLKDEKGRKIKLI